MFGPPVDLSFKNISALTESWKIEPTRGLRPLRRDSDRKYSSRSLRLSNNNIKDLHDLFRPINHFLSEPSLLSWLDLSFNQISHIHSVLCELRELRVLYLHANAIFIMSEVYVLAALPHLHTVTLHGNVIETEQGYRWLDGLTSSTRCRG
ncbi:leucine-rich repeat-containing protein 51 [Nelusetta ayraudi]|uniref:leucine-rich repeat-containing protein 51 n=1 Tax=Nelusetta ayraudi TaxID=303726 RepID=UPI003F7235EA